MYTLSEGTKAILGKLNQPIKIKLYYAKTATLKASDQIRFFNNYYDFVRTLLEEYVQAGNGMVELEVIDPRPYSEDEVQALRYGMQRFPITQEESFFFGLAVVTQFGVEKVIKFFSPDRQSFVEYDISYLIDTAITRQKRKIGVLSSLPVMGDDTSDYMVQMMRMQGQEPKGAWGFVQQLQQQYEVERVSADTDKIEDIDILLVVHPKDLPDKTKFAIDQFVLKGGRTIVCVDPHCLVDQPKRTMFQNQTQQTQSSGLNDLLKNWGLEMPTDTYAGDRDLALMTRKGTDQMPEKMIGFMNLSDKCFNKDVAMTANLNQVRLLFSGVLKEVDTPEDLNIERKALLQTTERGNSWSPELPVDMMIMNPTRLMSLFADGDKPVSMGYLVTGKFKSSFPDGVYVEKEDQKDPSDKSEEPVEKEKEHITGLTEAQEDCAVIVFADVDFISDIGAYENTVFGKMVVGDNAALMMNSVEELTGSSDLISIRSRGNFKRPFTVVDEIEKEEEEATAKEEMAINDEIKSLEAELNTLRSSAQQGQEDVVGDTMLAKIKEFELKIHEAERRKQVVKMKRREKIEALGRVLQNSNMLITPAITLLIAMVLGIRRSIRKRHYISHASDS
ncbi:MAG: Gldg family protein [Planctomycetota bacterium]